MALGRIGTVISYRLYHQVGRARGTQQERQSLPADLLEGEDGYLAIFDAPGTRAQDVQVRFLDGAVRVRVERAREYRENFQLRFPGRGTSLDGEVALPPDAVVDPDESVATVTDWGTIRIELPRVDGDTPTATGTTEAEAVAVDD